MKQKIIITILWMVIFAAAIFSIGPISLAIMVYSRTLSDTSVENVMWVWRFILISSPLGVLFLGLRGTLPGTKPFAIGSHGKSTISRILVCIVVIILVSFTLGTWIAFRPPPGRPNVSIAFLGYTNDATGARLAKIAVTNLNASTIFVYEPNIELQAPTDPSGFDSYFSGVNCSWHSMLDGGASGSFTIPPPTNRSPWRLRLLVYPDFGADRIAITRIVSISCLSIGLMPRYVRLPYDIEGDWIKSDQ